MYNITDTKHFYPANSKPYIEYKFQFEFKNRKEYLAFRKEWKEEYLTLSKDIREAKLSVKNEMRRQAAEKNHEYYSVWKQEGHKFTLQDKARMMMQMIEAAKKVAGLQQEQMLDARLQEAS
jgi:hypothetical protein